jgi:hypothetical protein
MEVFTMKTLTKILPVMVVVLAAFLLSGCYTTISQSVYVRPVAQFPDEGAIQKSVPINEDNVSQEDSVAVSTDQEESEADNEAVEQDNREQYQDDSGQYTYRPHMDNDYYNGPYAYDDMRYRPGLYGSYIWDPYYYTPHINFGISYNSWDPFYWHDPWAFGFRFSYYDPWFYNSWYYNPWYTPYYAMFDPWYYSGYNYGYYGGYGYDSWHHYGNHHGGRQDDYASGPRYTRQDRLAGFGAYSSSGGIYTHINSSPEKTAVRSPSEGPVTRVGNRDGFGTINTRRGSNAGTSQKSASGTVAAPEKRTVSHDNSTTRQRVQPGGMIRRGSSQGNYTIVIPDDGSGRPVVKYRDENSQPQYQNDIRIKRQTEPDEAAVREAASANSRRAPDFSQIRRTRAVTIPQSGNTQVDNSSDTDRAVSRPAPAQNSTPAQTSSTEKTQSYTPSPSRDSGRDSGRSTPSYSTPSRGGSSPSYSPRSGGGSSSGSQGRSSGSRSGGRRR